MPIIKNNSTQIQISETITKEVNFPNNLILNASGNFEILNSEELNDDISISDDESVTSEITTSNNNDDMTIGTETVDTNEINKYKNFYDISNDSIVENLSLENLNESEEENKYIDEFFKTGKSSNQADFVVNKSAKHITNNYSSYDKESKEVKGRPSACVFVASLSSNLTDDILCESVTNHFKQWGKMSLVKVLRDPANRPYAFVQYVNDEDADLAINEGQHSILNGRTVRCEKARVNRTLYLKLSDSGISERLMNKLLLRFGEIERLVAVNDNFNVINSTNQKLNYKNWFCKFVYRQDAINAFANLKNQQGWNIEWAQNLEDEYSNIPEVTIDKYSVFVGHLDPTINKEELISRFEEHGKIREAILVNRPLSNFAFIKFKTKEAAAAAVEKENHSIFNNKTIHVQYREMYNNYRRKFLNDNGLKLNLAPPPVNFKKKNTFNNDHGQIKHHSRSYRFRNKSYFNNVIDNNDKISNNNQVETFSQAMKIKHSFHNKNGRFNSRGGNEHQNFHKRSLSNSVTTTQVPQDDSEENDSKCTISNSCTASKSFDDQEHKTIEHKNLSFNENMEMKENKSNIDNEYSVFENEENHETSTAKSPFSNAGPKSGYTYSSIDSSEYNMVNLQGNSIMNHGSLQYPYYFYYPVKDAPYMNPQIHPMANSEPFGTLNNGPSIPGTGYYYPYSNYHPPNTPNGQIPPVYPMYYYYNPVSMVDHPSRKIPRGSGLDNNFLAS
jgi:RNA recognition motif-containing protein